MSEQRSVPEELEDGYNAHRYGDTTAFPALAERLDHATAAQLLEMARGGIGEPNERR